MVIKLHEQSVRKLGLTVQTKNNVDGFGVTEFIVIILEGCLPFRLVKRQGSAFYEGQQHPHEREFNDWKFSNRLQ